MLTQDWFEQLPVWRPAGTASVRVSGEASLSLNATSVPSVSGGLTPTNGVGKYCIYLPQKQLPQYPLIFNNMLHNKTLVY